MGGSAAGRERPFCPGQAAYDHNNATRLESGHIQHASQTHKGLVQPEGQDVLVTETLIVNTSTCTSPATASVDTCIDLHY